MRIAIVAFFISVALVGSVIVALHSPADCTVVVDSTGRQNYVGSSCR